MIKKIFFNFLYVYLLVFAVSLYASETLRLHGEQSIEVHTDGGKSLRLGPGALIVVSRAGDSSWAWPVQVIRRSADSTIETSPTWAKMGKQTLHEYLEQGVLGEPDARVERSSGARNKRDYRIVGGGSVEVLEGDRRHYLTPGAGFVRANEKEESWKTALVVTSSINSDLIGKTVHIGRSYFDQLVESGHIAELNSKGQLPDNQTTRFRPPKKAPNKNVSAQLECPESADYTVEQSFFFDFADDSTQSEALSITPGSTIELVEGDDLNRCHFVLTEARESDLQSYIGQELLTYPSNLTQESLSPSLSAQEQELAKSQQLDFKKGTRFVLNSPGVLSAHNIESGRSKMLPASFELDVEHAGGYLIRLRGQDGEHYIVERSELEKLRSDGEVLFDSVESLNQGVKEIEKLEVGELPHNCPPNVEESGEWQEDDPIVWESCRTQNQVGSNGRQLLANDYYDNLIQELSNFGSQEAQNWLGDSQQRELSKCIKQSLKGGLPRNIRPVCDFDARGDLITRPIRRTVTKKNSRGVPYKELEILKAAPRACASKTTSVFLAKKLERASQCLGLDPLEIFDLINHESHFQPGAISSTGALSVGQTVVSNYLQIHKSLGRARTVISKGGQRLEDIQRFSDPEVYRTQYENSRRRSETRYTTFLVSELGDKIKNPEAHGCEDLKSLLENPLEVPAGKDPAQHVLDHENQRLCLPEQPGQSFLMAGLDYLANKKYAKALVGNWTSKNGVNGAQKPEHLEDISQTLGKWMYNGGQEGMAQSFEYFMQELEAGRVTMRDDELRPVVKNGRTQMIQARSLSELSLEDFKKYMSVHIKQRYPGAKRRKTEVAGYIQKMDRDVQRIEKRGLRCTL